MKWGRGKRGGRPDFQVLPGSEALAVRPGGGWRRRGSARDRIASDPDYQPKPFHKTQEMRQVYGLGVLLVTLVVFFFMFRGKTPDVLTRVFPAQAPGEQGDPQSRKESLASQAAEERRAYLAARSDERRREIAAAFDGALADSASGDGFAETDGYRALLRHLLDHAPSAVSRPSVVPLDYEAALREPDAWRGKYVSVRGFVVNLAAQRLEKPVWGRANVFRGFLSDINGRQRVAFDIPNPPPPAEFEKSILRDEVEIQGIFYRTVRFEDRRGKPQEMPYLLAHDINVVAVAPQGFATFLHQHTTNLVVMLVLLLGSGFLAFRIFKYGGILGVRKPAGPVGFRRMFESKLRAEGRAAAKSAPSVNRRTDGDL